MFPTNAPALADKLAFETDQRYGALVRLFLEDGLKVGDPESTLGDGFGFFQFGPGLSPLSAAGTPLAEFFNTAANDLRTDRPMSEWDPAGDIVWAVNGFVRWFTKDGVVAQMPWLGNEKVLWLTGVNRQGRGEQHPGKHANPIRGNTQVKKVVGEVPPEECEDREQDRHRCLRVAEVQLHGRANY